MFSRLTAVSVLALSLLAVATPNPIEGRWGSPTTSSIVTTTITVTAPATTATEPAGSCNTGDLQCCQSVQTAGSAAGQDLLGPLSIVLSNLDVLIGGTCSPISIIGIGSGSACDANPVCCENNSIPPIS
ncbi:hypothetical protein PHLCEN_2v11004 [Hermanssonia centrifuga]|uniref:Hydrophobin n=1 Tax=Hermanssonia centrifuga TaxID=98765 RepID=A0A2R6NLM1_9APHY|nr:hypothetical protein PHLCEN_2v11004 [Hermanssonia centrifuga]